MKRPLPVVSFANPPPPRLMASEKWYALRVFYGGSKKVLRIKSIFDEDDIETFLPMHYSNRQDPKHPDRPLLVPALKELVMIRASEEQYNEVRNRHEGNRDLRYVDFYRYRRGENMGQPIEIPDRQMQQFMKYVKDSERSVDFFTDEQLREKKGRPVEVISGQFQGVKGLLMRIEKNRHVVIVLPGVMGASLPHIPVSMLRFIEEV